MDVLYLNAVAVPFSALHINLHKLCVVFILFNKMITYIIITSHIWMDFDGGCAHESLPSKATAISVDLI